MSGNEIVIRKGLLRGVYVSYRCPLCKDPLTSSLDEVGTQDECPICSGNFVVPGDREREEYLEDQRRQRDLAAESRRQAKLQKEQRALEKKQRKELEENEKQQSLLLQERQRQQKLKQSHPATPVVARSSVKEGVGDRKRRCPFCAEEILAAAAKCKHCGEFLDGHRESRHGSERMIVVEKEGGGGCGTIVTIALGIVLAVIILAFL